MMKLKIKTFIILFLINCYFISNLDGSKILGIFPMGSKSHYSLGNTLMRGLAEAGHDVTIISPHYDTLPTKNGSYRNVVLTGFVEMYEGFMKKINLFEDVYINSFFHFLKFQKGAAVIIDKIFSHPNIRELLDSSETFDVVIVEQVACEALKYIAHHFKAHLILFSSIAADSKLNYVVGNPTMLSYTPQVDTDFSREMTLYQRIYNTLLYLFEAGVMHYHWIPLQDNLLKKHFPDAPSLVEINNNVSLILVNSHESIQPSIPLVPNVIPIGGFHIKSPKRLPNELQKYLDNSPEGVVYVSFGSTLKSVNLPEAKRKVLLSTFRKLKQKVLWKWEDDNIDDLPPNVKIGKWLPQMDVLTHPNVKLFITQGGILSLTETVVNGVPVLVIPIFGDQATNAQNAVLDGYGLTIAFHSSDFTETKISSLIEELLINPKHKEAAKKRSQIYHDRQVDPLKEAVYWIEYIIRYEGAPHLRVAGMKLPWYQHYLLDVVIIITGVVFITLILFVKVIIFLLKFLKIFKTVKNVKDVEKSKRKIKKS